MAEGREPVGPLRPLLFTLAALIAIGLAGSPGSDRSKLEVERAAAAPATPPQLPRGGRSVLPQHRVVAFDGAPQAEALGILGIGPPSRAARALHRQSRPYRRFGRPLLPAFELIAVIALASPGRDGRYRARQKPRTVWRYLRAARRNNFLLLLDIQPGRSDFLTEVKAFKRFLRMPDVGIALDPEWRMYGGQRPGQVIGHIKAGELNRVTGYLQRLTRRRNLPDKLVVVHQFTTNMIRNVGRVKRRPNLDIVLNADGVGSPGAKAGTYKRVSPRKQSGFHRGFKLFYEEDTKLMKPRQVLRLRPRPVDLIVYE